MPEENHTKILLELKGISKDIGAVKEQFEELNGSVKKHADKFNDQGIINNQITMTQLQMTKEVADIHKKTDGNTEYVTELKGSIATAKWILGFVGFGNLIILLKFMVG